MTELEIRRLIWTCFWKSRGRAPWSHEYVWWLAQWPELEVRAMQLRIANYPELRLLGWKAHDGETVTYGDFAAPPTPFHAVPPYPGDAPLGSRADDLDWERLVDAMVRIADGVEHIAKAVVVLTAPMKPAPKPHAARKS